MPRYLVTFRDGEKMNVNSLSEDQARIKALAQRARTTQGWPSKTKSGGKATSIQRFGPPAERKG